MQIFHEALITSYVKKSQNSISMLKLKKTLMLIIMKTKGVTVIVELPWNFIIVDIKSIIKLVDESVESEMYGQDKKVSFIQSRNW